jgi:hypothetical protein
MSNLINSSIVLYQKYSMSLQRINFTELNTGYEFPPVNYNIDSTMAEDYLNAVGEHNTIFKNNHVIPPMALIAFAMAALTRTIEFPPGAIHVSQDIEFLHSVTTDYPITSRARISRKQKMGDSFLITIELNGNDDQNNPVFKGKTMFILPTFVISNKNQ